MRLIDRLQATDGDDVHLKWMYCEPCEMEWRVPDCPDAIPEFCCHCCRRIDPNLKPSDVFEEIEVEQIRKPDCTFDVRQHTVFSLSRLTEFRIVPIEEFDAESDDEVDVIKCGHRLEFLVNRYVMFAMEVPHETLLRLVARMMKYVSTCFNFGFENNESMVDRPELDEFKKFGMLADWDKNGKRKK